jgi:RNA polymerase sigma-54 factor
MRHSFGQRQSQRVSITTKIDPRVVLTSQVLQLNCNELSQMVESEMLENPALERIDELNDPITDEEVMEVVAPGELSGDHSYDTIRSTPQDAGTAPDWVDLTAAADSLCDSLLAQLHSALEEEHWLLADYFVGSIDDRGYLSTTVEEAALDCNCSLERATAVLAVLQNCEPPGIGATDLRECLMLQLRDPATETERLARLLLTRHWDHLVKTSKTSIQKKLKIPIEEIEDAFEVILKLRPHPTDGFRRQAGPARAERSPAATPDLIIEHTESGWKIEAAGPSHQAFRVSSVYTEELEKLDAKYKGHSGERRHIAEHINRAEWFLGALTSRQQLLTNIAKHLIEHQAGFLKTGDYRFLEPMTRSKMASIIGAHESTVSRAAKGKFLRIASGDVISFEVLFKPALKVQKMIEEILRHENPNSPLSDERISEILAEQGVKVARRTVNKYRDRHKLLSSRHRKSA